jgi:hypothetical protein
MRARGPAAAILGLALLFQGCNMHVERPVLHPRTVDFAGAEAEGVVFRVTIAAYNPNTFDLPLFDLQARLLVTGSSVPAQVTRLDAVLPPQREVFVTADVHVPWRAWPTAAWAAMTHPVLHYRVEGDISAEHYIAVRSHFTIEGDVARQQLIEGATHLLGPLS